MAIKFAFAGFQHGHIMGVYNLAKQSDEIEIVASCEEDAKRREELQKTSDVNITHDNYQKMLDETECDVIAVGDIFAKRGQITIKALEKGKHVISDKPICCKLEELEQIKKFVNEKNLIIGCQLDLRGSAAIRKMKQLIDNDEIGEIHTITFTGQHPLAIGVRPNWYFEDGLHGGTINDIAVHGIDAIEWMTGRKIVQVVAARVWNAKAKQYPDFQDGAQFMLKLDNEGGVISDISYLTPDGAYDVPNYYRFTIHGDKGQIEATYKDKSVLLIKANDKTNYLIAADSPRQNSYFIDFINQVKGNTDNIELTNKDVIRAAYVSLVTQKAADENKTYLSVT